MEYVVVTKSRKRDEFLFLVDRRKQTKSFWSHGLADVMKFPSHKAAQAVASALKFNDPKVWPLHVAENHVSGHVSSGPDLLEMLNRHMALWHDPDWNEGTNGSGCGPFPEQVQP